MPTGIEIASIILASTGMGGSAAKSAAEFARKGTAGRTYDQAVQQYTQLKELRKDIAINQCLSADDKDDLDRSIEAIAFDLMELQAALQELRGVAYYKLTVYSTKWIKFNDRASLTFKLIVEVNEDIMKRSTQGRERARLEAQQEVGLPTSQSAPSSLDQPVAASEGSISGDSLNRQIADAMACSAAAALRASLEGGIKSCSHAQADNCRAGLSGRSQSIIETGLKPGLKWHISPKSTSVPPSLAGIELKDRAKELD